MNEENVIGHFVFGFKRVECDGFYSIPHRLVIFTSMKITKATMMKVINATKKLPIPKAWLETVTV